MQRGRQMTALQGWCTSSPATAHSPFQSPQVQRESGVGRKMPAPILPLLHIQTAFSDVCTRRALGSWTPQSRERMKLLVEGITLC
jgi:hypothetical protein